jgi:hypothetical protein
MVTTASDFLIARVSIEGGSGHYTAGIFDDVRIYQSALSSSEIQKIYAEEKAGHTMANNN